MSALHYDPAADILRLVFRETTVFLRRLADGIAVDYDKDGRLAGIEITDALRRLGVDVLRNVVPGAIGPALSSIKEHPPSPYGGSAMLIISEPIPLTALLEMSKDSFDGLIKAVVDIEKGLIALNGDLHSDEESALLALGSRQEDLWGINIHPGRPWPDRIEFDSMINVRPNLGNRTRGVDDSGLRRRILDIAARMIAE